MKLAFVLSHACPLECNFCCSTRDVVGPGRIRRETIEESLIRFAAEPAFLDFGFTGGDPFLYLADIKAAVAGARRAGVSQPFQMTTSAYWAKDEAGVHSILTELKALGLNQLMLSYDSEHAKWVSATQITAVCDVAERLGISIHISATFWDLKQDLRDLLPEIVDRPNVKVLHHTVAPMGRARETAAWPRRYDLPVESKLSCGRPGEYLFSVYPDGEVYPCCSGGFQIEGRLSCGNIHRDTPAKIIYAGMTNFHVRLAKEFGWAVLYAVVEREAPELVAELPRFEDADSVCEICRDLNLNFGERLAPVRDVIEREYARARAGREWRRLDASGAQRSIGGHLMSLDAFLALIESDRAIRLDYLAGVLQLDASPVGSDETAPREVTLAHASNGSVVPISPSGTEGALRGAIALRPDDLASRLALADALLERGDMLAAFDLLKDALLIDHRNVATLLAFARVQLRLGNLRQAEAACRTALETEPGDQASLNQLAAVLLNADRAAEALAVADSAMKRDPADPVARRRRANALRVLGRTSEARQILRDLNAADPASAAVLVALADIEPVTPGHALIDQLRAAIAAAAISDPMLPPLHYALGKALDLAGEYDEAFEHFRRGGELTRSRVSYDEALVLAALARIKDVFAQALPIGGRTAPRRVPAPLFIVGMPRSGSTLVEQILSQHRDVHCSGETMAFAEALAAIRRDAPSLPLYPDFISLIDAATLGGVGTAYRDAISRAGAAVHVNKLLGNFMFIGAIRLALPDAKFVEVRRDPLDSCLSAFSLHFDQRVPYSYDLGELGRYYSAYDRTMSHWKSVLPAACMHEVVYEALVENLEGETRRLLDFLGLDWEPACLSFHESLRPVLTASVDQVRRPLYTSAIGRWRRYERHLGPLMAALGSS